MSWLSRIGQWIYGHHCSSTGQRFRRSLPPQSRQPAAFRLNCGLNTPDNNCHCASCAQLSLFPDLPGNWNISIYIRKFLQLPYTISAHSTRDRNTSIPKQHLPFTLHPHLDFLPLNQNRCEQRNRAPQHIYSEVYHGDAYFIAIIYHGPQQHCPCLSSHFYHHVILTFRHCSLFSLNISPFSLSSHIYFSPCHTSPITFLYIVLPVIVLATFQPYSDQADSASTPDQSIASKTRQPPKSHHKQLAKSWQPRSANLNRLLSIKLLLLARPLQHQQSFNLLVCCAPSIVRPPRTITSTTSTPHDALASRFLRFTRTFFPRPTPRRLDFFHLPQHIRERIYLHVFQDDNPIDLN